MPSSKGCVMIHSLSLSLCVGWEGGEEKYGVLPYDVISLSLGQYELPRRCVMW